MYNFELTEQEANLVLQALGEMPAKMSMGLIAKLQEQARPQIEANKPKEEVEAINQEK